MHNTSERVLILGGSGFLGRGLLSYWLPLVDDRYLLSVATRNSQLTDVTKYSECSLCEWDYSSGFDEIIRFDPHIIINLMGTSHPRSSKNNILTEVNQAILPFFDLLLKLKGKNLNSVVFASSSNAIYKDIDPARNNLCFPTDPYTATKISIEGFLSAFSFESDVKTVSLRISNPVGIDLSKDDFGVVNTFARKVISHEPVNFYDDSEVYKDYICIDDVSSAIVAAVSHIGSIPFRSMIFDVGSGYSLSAKSIYSIVEAFHAGREVDRSLLKPSKFMGVSSTEKYLQWKPEIDVYDSIYRVYHQLKASR